MSHTSFHESYPSPGTKCFKYPLKPRFVYRHMVLAKIIVSGIFAIAYIAHSGFNAFISSNIHGTNLNVLIR